MMGGSSFLRHPVEYSYHEWNSRAMSMYFGKYRTAFLKELVKVLSPEGRRVYSNEKSHLHLFSFGGLNSKITDEDDGPIKSMQMGTTVKLQFSFIS